MGRAHTAELQAMSSRPDHQRGLTRHLSCTSLAAKEHPMRRRTAMTLVATLALGGGLLRRALAALGTAPPESTMAAIADTMLPGGDGLPPASALGLHKRV